MKKIIICQWLIVLFVLCNGVDGPVFANEYKEERLDMIENQIKRRGISNERVINAMKKVERHLFVPEEMKDIAYTDGPLPIGEGQTISQPFIVAYMTDMAQLKSNDRVLEVGTGSGYQAAILAEIVKEVYSVEIVKTLAQEAKDRLSELGYSNVHVKWGDGYQGWKEHAPYDAIIITAAPPSVPEELIDQLKIDGTLVVPVGNIFQELLRIKRQEKGYTTEKLIPVRFVPMVKNNANEIRS